MLSLDIIFFFFQLWEKWLVLLADLRRLLSEDILERQVVSFKFPLGLKFLDQIFIIYFFINYNL
jgi:hypothetical protein